MSVKSGVKAKQVDLKAKEIIKKAGYEKFFGHATGHGVGLDIHEFPHISFHSKDVLQEGMVFTIEPGIYIPEIGGVRIEDMIYIDNNEKPIVLTNLPKELEIIG